VWVVGVCVVVVVVSLFQLLNYVTDFSQNFDVKRTTSVV
jgi:hypothetical protein